MNGNLMLPTWKILKSLTLQARWVFVPHLPKFTLNEEAHRACQVLRFKIIHCMEDTVGEGDLRRGVSASRADLQCPRGVKGAGRAVCQESARRQSSTSTDR